MRNPLLNIHRRGVEELNKLFDNKIIIPEPTAYGLGFNGIDDRSSRQIRNAIADPNNTKFFEEKLKQAIDVLNDYRRDLEDHATFFKYAQSRAVWEAIISKLRELEDPLLMAHRNGVKAINELSKVAGTNSAGTNFAGTNLADTIPHIAQPVAYGWGFNGINDQSSRQILAALTESRYTTFFESRRVDAIEVLRDYKRALEDKITFLGCFNHSQSRAVLQAIESKLEELRRLREGESAKTKLNRKNITNAPLWNKNTAIEKTFSSMPCFKNIIPFLNPLDEINLQNTAKTLRNNSFASQETRRAFEIQLVLKLSPFLKKIGDSICSIGESFNSFIPYTRPLLDVLNALGAVTLNHANGKRRIDRLAVCECVDKNIKEIAERWHYTNLQRSGYQISLFSRIGKSNFPECLKKYEYFCNETYDKLSVNCSESDVIASFKFPGKAKIIGDKTYGHDVCWFKIKEMVDDDNLLGAIRVILENAKDGVFFLSYIREAFFKTEEFKLVESILKVLNLLTSPEILATDISPNSDRNSWNNTEIRHDLDALEDLYFRMFKGK